MTTPTPKKRGRPAKAKPTAQAVSATPAAPTEDRAVAYRIELRIGPSTITSEGRTMLEALQSLEKPNKIISKGTIKVFHGENSKEIFYMPVQMKRIFYPLAQVTVAKMLAMNL